MCENVSKLNEWQSPFLVPFKLVLIIICDDFKDVSKGLTPSQFSDFQQFGVMKGIHVSCSW
jgi:hypothetical protein